MATSLDARLNIGRLLTAWVGLAGWIFTAIAARCTGLFDRLADRVKDGIIDLGSGPDQDPTPVAREPSLPPVDPKVLGWALEPCIMQALAETAAAINEDPDGCLAALTEERVLALFQALGEVALAQAQELRFAAAEAALPGQVKAPGEWARRYRRIQFEEMRDSDSAKGS
jgi:hypothetical protein